MVKKDIFWIFGYSGAGKTTIGRMLEEYIKAGNKEVSFLDGDVNRKKMTKKSFTDQGRFENIRQMMFLAEQEADKGNIVIACFTTPHRGARSMLKKYLGERLCLIYLVADIDIVWKRDPKGLYQKLIDGEIQNFSGADLRFDIPMVEEVRIAINTNVTKMESFNALLKLFEVYKIEW